MNCSGLRTSAILLCALIYHFVAWLLCVVHQSGGIEVVHSGADLRDASQVADMMNLAPVLEGRTCPTLALFSLARLYIGCISPRLPRYIFCFSTHLMAVDVLF